MAASSRRCFLAIGIQNYSSPLDQLKNAASDAASVQTLFQQLGYRTQLSCHLCNIQEVRDALQKFGQLVREDTEVIILYLVGHGIAVSGKARLQLQNASGLHDGSEENSVEVDYLLNELLSLESRANSFVLMMNDFCRSEICQEAQQGSVVKLAARSKRWLERRYATLWSTGANRDAYDGEFSDGRGPFAKSLVYRITDSKNLSLDNLRDQLAADVSLWTEKGQRVHMYSSSLEGVPFFFDHLGNESTASTDLESRSSLTSFTSDRNDRNRARCSGYDRNCARCFGISLLCIVIVAALIAVVVVLLQGPKPNTFPTCRFGDWYNDGSCSVTCGGGYQKQERTMEDCPASLKRTEKRMQRCNMLACPSDCCFFEDCPFLADLMCNESSCQPFLNMTVCEFPEPGSVRFPSTVQGRMVRWTFQHWRKSSVTLLDEDSQILSINKLNESAKWKSEQAVCECLQDFAEVILRKKFIASCVDLPQPVAEYKESKDLRRHGAFLAPAQL